jgi:hypothetical protein
VLGRRTPSMNGKQDAPLPRELGRAVALGRVLVLTWPNFNDLFTIGHPNKNSKPVDMFFLAQLGYDADSLLIRFLPVNDTVWLEFLPLQ